VGRPQRSAGASPFATWGGEVGYFASAVRS